MSKIKYTINTTISEMDIAKHIFVEQQKILFSKLEKLPGYPHIIFDGHKTLLSIFIRTGHINFTKKLLEAGAELELHPDNFMVTPQKNLETAVLLNNNDMFDLLLKHGYGSSWTHFDAIIEMWQFHGRHGRAGTDKMIQFVKTALEYIKLGITRIHFDPLYNEHAYKNKLGKIVKSDIASIIAIPEIPFFDHHAAFQKMEKAKMLGILTSERITPEKSDPFEPELFSSLAPKPASISSSSISSSSVSSSSISSSSKTPELEASAPAPLASPSGLTLAPGLAPAPGPIPNIA